MRRRSLLIAAGVVPFVGAPVMYAGVDLAVPIPAVAPYGIEHMFHEALFPKMLYGRHLSHLIIDDPPHDHPQTEEQNLMLRRWWDERAEL